MYLLLKVPQPFVENGLQYLDPGLDWAGTHSLVRSCGLDCYQVAARMSPMKMTYREVSHHAQNRRVFKTVLKYLPSSPTAEPLSTAAVKAATVGLKPGPGDSQAW